MSDLVAVAYKDLPTAQQVAQNLSEAQKQHLISLEDAVIVERQADGKVKLHQPSLGGAGAAGGALWGGLIGMIFLVPLLGMAIGAASGAAAGALSDTGVDDDFLKELGSKLDEGGAALILLVRRHDARQAPVRDQDPRRGHPDVAEQCGRDGVAGRARRRQDLGRACDIPRDAQSTVKRRSTARRRPRSRAR